MDEAERAHSKTPHQSLDIALGALADGGPLKNRAEHHVRPGRIGRVLYRLGDGLATGRFAVWRGMLDLGVDLSPTNRHNPVRYNQVRKTITAPRLPYVLL